MKEPRNRRSWMSAKIGAGPIVGPASVVLCFAAIACNPGTIVESRTAAAMVLGTAMDNGAAAAGRTVSVAAFSTGCGGRPLGFGSAVVSNTGAFRVNVVAQVPGGRLCVIAHLPPASGADTVSIRAEVEFRPSAPYDSVRVDIAKQAG